MPPEFGLALKLPPLFKHYIYNVTYTVYTTGVVVPPVVSIDYCKTAPYTNTSSLCLHFYVGPKIATYF